MSTHFDSNSKLKKNKDDRVSQLLLSNYWFFMYVSNYARLDILCVLNRLNRHTSNLYNDHQVAIEKIFKFFEGIIDYDIKYIGFL